MNKYIGPLEMSFNSNAYWTKRYQTGGNSGAGSRGRLAQFKADFLNNFVQARNIQTVAELGSGDGYYLQPTKFPKYTGYDISTDAVKRCQDLIQRPDYDFVVLTESAQLTPAQLALSLDVIFHLIEDSVYQKYMQRLFSLGAEWVIIYSSNLEDTEFINKHGRQAVHVKSRKFTDYVASTFPEWELESTVENPYPYKRNQHNETSFSDFFIYHKHQ